MKSRVRQDSGVGVYAVRPGFELQQERLNLVTFRYDTKLFDLLFLIF